MNPKNSSSATFSDFSIGLVVIALSAGTIVYFLTRSDDCLDKARAFVSTAPAVTAKAGRVISASTSEWLSGQARARAGERSFYFLVKGERGTANAVVSADRKTCTCRVTSVY